MDEHKKITRLLRIDQVEDLTAISRSHIYHLAALGQFPKQVNVFGRSVRWIAAEIEDWIDKRCEGRRSNGEAA
jgi:predicted DNA-binding transcriptional regulator AlpA